MADSTTNREIWILGLGNRQERCHVLCDYLAAGGYQSRIADLAELPAARPLGIILDLSPYAADGWGILLRLKADKSTREIPVLPVFLSEDGDIGSVFPVAGFFTLPIDSDYLVQRLAVLGLTEDVQEWDLQAMVVSRSGEEKLEKALNRVGFEVVNAYSGTEAVALATIGRPYLAFSTLMLSDMPAFELQERFRLYPNVKNVPFFVLIKDAMKEAEKNAIAKDVAHLVRKKWLNQEEFLAFLRRRG